MYMVGARLAPALPRACPQPTRTTTRDCPYKPCQIVGWVGQLHRSRTTTRDCPYKGYHHEPGQPQASRATARDCPYSRRVS